VTLSQDSLIDRGPPRQPGRPLTWGWCQHHRHPHRAIQRTQPRARGPDLPGRAGAHPGAAAGVCGSRTPGSGLRADPGPFPGTRAPAVEGLLRPGRPGAVPRLRRHAPDLRGHPPACGRRPG